MTKRGCFITIEGIEGAGKSTVLDYVMRFLAQRKIKAIKTREPGGTEIAEKIRDILLHSAAQESLEAKTELLLMFAGRMQHIKHCILPALEQSEWVVSDRYLDASYAYQGGGRELSVDDINVLDKLIVDGLYPDLTLLLDLPVNIGFERTKQRGNKPDRIEQEKKDFFERVRRAYLQRAEQEPKRIRIIDASGDIDSVKAQIQQVLEEFVA